MKNTWEVTITTSNIEVKIVKPDALLVSKTDLEGCITYCNSEFMIYSGFYLEELVGKEAFSTAHPDMPSAIFHHIWKELKVFNEVCCVVKNKSKSNEDYWTFLNATPSFDSESQHIGYFFMQRSATTEASVYFQALYSEMRAIEESSSGIQAMNDSFQILENAAEAKGGHNEFVFSYYA